MGNDPSPEDPLAPSGPAAGWSELELDTDAVQSGSHAKPSYDPGGMAGDQMVGDPFAGLDAGPIPDLELEELQPLPADLPVPEPPPASREPVDKPTAGVVREIADVEVEALADYGEAPASFVMWVPYAILVATRRQALKKALAELGRLRATARADAQEAMIELGRGLHANGDKALAPLGPLLQACDDTGTVAAGRTEEWAKSREAADAQRGSLQSKIDEAEKAVGPFRNRETKLGTQMDSLESNLRRARAKQSRVEIEIRNLRQLASQPGEAIDAPKLELLEAQLEACRPDTDKAQGRVDELAPQLASARKELAVMLSAVNDLEKQRRAIDQAQDRTEKVHLSTAGDAEKEYHEAVQALAEGALQRRIGLDVEPALTRTAELMGRTLDSRERDIEVHEAALHAYDKGSFQKGWAIIAIAALIVVAMLIFIIVR